jgi:L-ribulose-5-phosphate 4-epimerase
MVEDVARAVHIAAQVGELVRIDQSDIDRLFDRYQNVYGQRGWARRQRAKFATRR